MHFGILFKDLSKNYVIFITLTIDSGKLNSSPLAVDFLAIMGLN